MKRGPRNSPAFGIRTNIASPIGGGPPSPTLSSATTQASGMPVPGGPSTIITRAHLKTSVQAYEELLRTSTDYRNALSTLADASARFAAAIESCSRLKGVSDDASISFQAAGGLYHIIGNHEQVLSDTIRKNFDKPLRQHLQAYRQQIAERSAAYEQSLVEKNRLIRRVEKENMNIGRRRQRDLNSFRAALNLLQQQVAELDHLKADYYTQVLTHEEETWDLVLGKVALVVRSTLDVYDRISAKASDPSLESMILSVPDPFDAYGPQKSEDHIYSIVPVGILKPNDQPSPSLAPSPLSENVNIAGVQTWMDQASAAREVSYQSQPAIPDWTNVDWTDIESRARRHSLPGPYPTTSNPSQLPTTSLSTSPPSEGIPFPSGSSPDRSARSRSASKLRNVLSVIGEGNSLRQPSEEPFEDDFSLGTAQSSHTESSRASIPSITTSEDEGDGLVDEVDGAEDQHESESDDGGGSGDDRTVQLGVS